MQLKLTHTKDMVIKKLLKKILKSSRVVKDHTLSGKDIPSTALRVIQGLQQAGFVAYLVGGCVRDLLLGLTPKDFDVATDAHPEQVRRLFRNARVIGRRFKLVHVVFGREIIEVSTFRKNVSIDDQAHAQSEHGLLVRDNAYGSAKEMEQDAKRRDFSVNALYYNPTDASLMDFVGGLKDLQQGVLRIIGEPEQRFREDPVRIIRAVRLAAKVGLHLDKPLVQAIPNTRQLLSHISPARLFDEMVKVMVSGSAELAFQSLRQYHLLDYLMPEVYKAINQQASHEQLIVSALRNTDQRIAQAKSINPAFMLAVWYWPVFLSHYQTNGQRHSDAFEQAYSQTVRIAVQHLHIPKRFTATMRDIWLLQYRFCHRQAKTCVSTLDHPKFRAGYDFLWLRVDTEPELQALASWWQAFYEGNDNDRTLLLQQLPVEPVKKRSRRKKKAVKPEAHA